MALSKFYFMAGLLLIAWLTWSNFRGFNILDNIFPDVHPGHYSQSGGVFHK